MKDDSTMAQLPTWKGSRRSTAKIGSIADLIGHRACRS
jgi:hypothetical protein